MACADADMDIHGAEEPSGACNEAPDIWHYQPLEMTPEMKRSLYDMLQKQPAVLGVMSGLFSFGLGIIFAVAQQMEYSLMAMFRVSHLSGTIMIFAGLISICLFKYPQLLQVLLVVNCTCIVVAAIAISLIIADVAHWYQKDEESLKLELLELSVLVFTLALSGLLFLFYFKEKRSKSP